MIHGWVRSIRDDGFPLPAAQAEGKGHRRRLRQHAVVSDAVVVVRIVGAAGKVNGPVFLRASGGDTVARASGMVGQLAPLNFRRIMTVDLSHPAFLGSNVLGLISRRILARA